MATVDTTTLNSSEVNSTWIENQTGHYQYYYYYYGDREPFNIFDLLPESYRNARVFLYRYLVIIIWIISGLGNTLVILVLSMKRNRGFSTSIYLTGLAFADLSLNTANTFILYFLAHGYIKPPASSNACRYRNVFQFAIAFIATWMLVVISLERVISVWMPFRVKRLCTANTAYIVTISLWIFFFGIAFLHESVMFLHPQYACQIRSDYKIVYNDYLQWILISVKFIIPYAIIFTCTIIIMVTLLKRKIQKSSTEQRNRGKSVNIVLINVNMVFLLTNTPYISFYLFTTYTSLNPNPILSYAYYLFWLVHLQVLNDCNSAVNVFVYFLVGSRFRNDVKKLLCGCFRNDQAGLVTGNHKDLGKRGTTISSTESSEKAEDMSSSKLKVLRRKDSQFNM